MKTCPDERLTSEQPQPVRAPEGEVRAHRQYLHITTAIGRDFQDVTPLRGIFYGGGQHDLSVAVDVNRIGEA